eukprot:496982-Pyramimonas_sp.AAC.1
MDLGLPTGGAGFHSSPDVVSSPANCPFAPRSRDHGQVREEQSELLTPLCSSSWRASSNYGFKAKNTDELIHEITSSTLSAF